MKCVETGGPSVGTVALWMLTAILDHVPDQIEELTGPDIEVDDLTVRLPSFTEQVRRGADLLDEKLPNWWHGIDTSALDLSSENSCILGQAWTVQFLASLYDGEAVTPDSGFEALVERLFGVTGEEAREVAAAHGFTLSHHHGRMLNYQTGWVTKATGVAWVRAWELLTETWLTEIRKRQQASTIATNRGRLTSAFDRAIALARAIESIGVPHQRKDKVQ